jgi:hypothetical protein
LSVEEVMQQFDVTREHERIAAVVNAATPGSYAEVAFRSIKACRVSVYGRPLSLNTD